MHSTSTKHIELSERVIERLEQAIMTIKASCGERLMEISLFGGYALGEYHQFSSVDLIVVVTESDIKFLKRKADLERMLNEDDQMPLIDPLVYTEDEILDLINKKESFIVSVLNEAIVVWNGFNEIDLKDLHTPKDLPSRYKASLPKLGESY